MNDSIARFVHPVFERGLDLRRRIEAEQAASIEAEQATLEDLIRRDPEALDGWQAGDPEAPAPAEPRRSGPTRGIEDIRYALTCWLDEAFILDSPWDSAWTESKMEARLFGTNERAWKFWERSASAELSPRADVLEVYYLCVALGFRGEMSASPDRLASWIERTRHRLAVAGPRPEAAALEPPCDVPPLIGRDRLRRAAFLACCLAIATIPTLVLILGVR